MTSLSPFKTSESLKHQHLQQSLINEKQKPSTLIADKRHINTLLHKMMCLENIGYILLDRAYL